MDGNLARALGSKRELAKTVLIVALVGLAINIIASLLTSVAGISPKYLWAGSLAILVYALLSYLATAYRILSFQHTIEAAVLIDKDNNELIAPRGYEFARDAKRVLEAIKVENQAIYAEWEREPLCKPRVKENQRRGKGDKPSFMAITRTNRPPDQQVPSSAGLLEEISLFVVLDMLSTHLSTYFNDHTDEATVREFSRDDFPDFLMKNRIINLLSTPIEQRPVFLTAFPDPEKRPEGEIFTLWGSDGSVYSRFDLNLPVGSKLEYLSKNGLRVSTRRLSLSLSVHMGLSESGVGPVFSKRYLGKEMFDIEARQIIINMKAKINPLYLVRSKGWDLYYWLDSFKDRLIQKTSFRDFKDSIHWDDIIEPLLFAMREAPRGATVSAKKDNSEPATAPRAGERAD